MLLLLFASPAVEHYGEASGVATVSGVGIGAANGVGSSAGVATASGVAGGIGWVPVAARPTTWSQVAVADWL